MKPADEREEELFEAALERCAGPEREAFLDQACAGDHVLRARLTALLEAHETTDSFLEPLAESPGERVHLSTPLTEKPGDHIGRYKLLQRIGEGGWGVVHLAEQEEPIRRGIRQKARPGAVGLQQRQHTFVEDGVYAAGPLDEGQSLGLGRQLQGLCDNLLLPVGRGGRIHRRTTSFQARMRLTSLMAKL